MDLFVKLEAEKCKGCRHCMMRCPTEAIRVRQGKASIISERCIACGNCARICPTRAKSAVYTPMTALSGYAYNIAVPCPSIYGQFEGIGDVNAILNALVRIGFDDVFEVAVGCEIVSEATRTLVGSPNGFPVINSSCPAVTKLIRIGYGQLAKHISPVKMPEEIAAAMAKDRAEKNTAFKRGEIGVFVIAPCAAKAEALQGAPDIDGVVGFGEIYFKLLAEIDKSAGKDGAVKRSETGRLGLQWGASGGEANGLTAERYLAADGIENVLTVLNELDHGKLADLQFIELNACPGGCVGGVSNIENPFMATARIRKLRYSVPITLNRFDGDESALKTFKNAMPPAPFNVFKLSDDRAEAIQLLKKIESIHRALPGIDCGVCGAPSCRAMAEDVVNLAARPDECVNQRTGIREQGLGNR
ncbi:MAG: 4Fe-4S binding protein [Firmicutes bacterium]|nr:4Fe-4S binding protein [Bacillota bacterium]